MCSISGIMIGTALVLAISGVSAHGFVSGIVAGGKWYEGSSPTWIYPTEKPPRPGWYALNQGIGYIGPSNYTHNSIACHNSATPGTTSVEVNAGEDIELQWEGWHDGHPFHWPDSHHGPVITSLARCHPDCTTASPDELKFFTIDQKGLIDGLPAPGTWASDQLIQQNSSWTVKIPSNIQGNFVLRHEIIALHAAMDQQGDDGAQNYPNCINLKVSGSANHHPCLEGADCKLATELYHADDPGILLSIYHGLGSYTIPGPRVWSGFGD